MIVVRNRILEACPNTPYYQVMTTQEIKDLPTGQKVQIMEVIWEDFRERFEGREIPQQYKDLLDQRRARVDSGEAELLEWDTVKSTIGRP